MNLLPIEKIEFESPLKLNEVKEVLNNEIAWTKSFGGAFTKNTYKEYEGYMENNTFKIRRILKWGTNSFIPIVSGTILDENLKISRIQLSIRLNKFVLIFFGILTLFSFFLIITDLVNLSSDESNVNKLLEQYDLEPIENFRGSNSFNWGNILFLIAPYLMIIIGFNYEAKKVKDKLKMILKNK